MNSDIKIGQLYRHRKGNLYQVVALGKHSETEEEMVGYRGADDGKTWFRPKAMFEESDRFTLVSVASNKKEFALETFGWYGTVATLAAYALISFGVLPSDSFWFQVLNLTGALGLTTISFYKKTYQPAVLDLIWAGIALVALIKIIF